MLLIGSDRFQADLIVMGEKQPYKMSDVNKVNAI